MNLAIDYAYSLTYLASRLSADVVSVAEGYILQIYFRLAGIIK